MHCFFRDAKLAWKHQLKIVIFFANTNLFHCKCHKINLNCLGSSINFLNWIMYLDYILQHNVNREKQVSIFMISNRQGWHYLAVKYWIPKRNYVKKSWWIEVWIFFICWEQKSNLKYKKVGKDKNPWGVLMPLEDAKILQFNQNWKSDKTSYIFQGFQI